MLWLTILRIVVLVVTIATGIFSLIKPKAIYGFTGLTASGPRGISEIRAIFGGLFIALGLAPFLFGEGAYLALGLGYLAIAVARAVSILIDKSRAQSNLVSLAIEIVCGVILMLRF